MTIPTLGASDAFQRTVISGPLLVAAGVAALVGVVGFLSPCVLPLVPGYLAYIAGLSGSDGREQRPGRMAMGALLFVSGFTAVFVATGALFGALGSSIADHRVGLEQVFGAVTIVMGVVFMGGLPLLQRERKLHVLPAVGLCGAPLLGLTFGLAWTPCLTPTFTAVYSLAASQATAGRGALLSVAYSLGLGVPFVLVALGLARVTSTLDIVRRHARLVSRLGGALLILIGVLLLTGTWDQWMNELRASFGSTGIGSGL